MVRGAWDYKAKGEFVIKTRQSVKGTIGAAEIIAAYQDAFHVSWFKVVADLIARFLGLGSIFQLADAYYGEIDDAVEERLIDFLTHDKTDLVHYKAEEHDCDDFAFRLMGLLHTDPVLCAIPVFITWVSWVENGQRLGHAVLSYYKSSVGVVKGIEPQNDRIFIPPNGWRLDLLCG